MPVKYQTSIRMTGASVTAIAAGIALLPALSTAPLSRAMVASFLVVAPAVAIARLLPSAHIVVALIVGVAGSIAVNTLVAQSMLSAELWSRPAGVIAVGVTAVALWLIPIPSREKWRG